MIYSTVPVTTQTLQEAAPCCGAAVMLSGPALSLSGSDRNLQHFLNDITWYTVSDHKKVNYFFKHALQANKNYTTK